jgi:tetrahydromethanopterin S-methyltransferase subunit F
MKLVRDTDGAWAAASTGKRIVGLVLGFLLSGLGLLIPVVLIVVFLTGRT